MNKNLSSILMFITSCYLGKEYVYKMNIEIKRGIFAFYLNITQITPTSGKAFKKKKKQLSFEALILSDFVRK